MAKQAKVYIVRKQGRQWGVYCGDMLIEGGFFARSSAESCAEDRNLELAACEAAMDEAIRNAGPLA